MRGAVLGPVVVAIILIAAVVLGAPTSRGNVRSLNASLVDFATSCPSPNLVGMAQWSGTWSFDGAAGNWSGTWTIDNLGDLSGTVQATETFPSVLPTNPGTVTGGFVPGSCTDLNLERRLHESD